MPEVLRRFQLRVALAMQLGLLVVAGLLVRSAWRAGAIEPPAAAPEAAARDCRVRAELRMRELRERIVADWARLKGDNPYVLFDERRLVATRSLDRGTGLQYAPWARAGELIQRINDATAAARIEHANAAETRARCVAEEVRVRRPPGRLEVAAAVVRWLVELYGAAWALGLALLLGLRQWVIGGRVTGTLVPPQTGEAPLTAAVAPPGPVTFPAQGGEVHVDVRYLRSRTYARPLVPPRALQAPIARLLAGRYRLGRSAGPVELGPADPQTRFVELVIPDGGATWVDVGRLVALSGAGRLETRLGAVRRLAAWLMGHPLPVVAWGPLALAFETRVPSWRPTTEPAIEPVAQLVAWDAGARFALLADEPQDRLAAIENVLGTHAYLRIERGPVLVDARQVERRGRARQLLAVLGHSAKLSLYLWLLGVALALPGLLP